MDAYSDILVWWHCGGFAVNPLGADGGFGRTDDDELICSPDCGCGTLGAGPRRGSRSRALQVLSMARASKSGGCHDEAPFHGSAPRPRDKSNRIRQQKQSAVRQGRVRRVAVGSSSRVGSGRGAADQAGERGRPQDEAEVGGQIDRRRLRKWARVDRHNARTRWRSFAAATGRCARQSPWPGWHRPAALRNASAAIENRWSHA